MHRAPGSLTKHRDTREKQTSPGLASMHKAMHSPTSSMTPLWRCHSWDAISYKKSSPDFLAIPGFSWSWPSRLWGEQDVAQTSKDWLDEVGANSLVLQMCP